MHIIDVIDEIQEKLTELSDGAIADIYNQLAEWGKVESPIRPLGEGQFAQEEPGEESE